MLHVVEAERTLSSPSCRSSVSKKRSDSFSILFAARSLTAFTWFLRASSAKPRSALKGGKANRFAP